MKDIRLIDADALKASFDERYDDAFVQWHTRANKEYWNGFCSGVNWGRNTITDATVAEPAQHGHWNVIEYEYFTCSVCGQSYYNGCDNTKEAKRKLENGDYYNYCPNCGARMEDWRS